MYQILVVDDHPVVRAGIQQLIDEIDGCTVADQANNRQEAIDLVMKNEYDLIILDISLPDANGLDLLKEIKNYNAEHKVLVLSRHTEFQYAFRALKLGALGYLNKQMMGEAFKKAVIQTLGGKRYITPEIAEDILNHALDKDENQLLDSLSDREYQVFERLVGGETISECAEKLHLSPNTVATYRQRILEKLHLKNNAQLMHYAVEHHLFE